MAPVVLCRPFAGPLHQCWLEPHLPGCALCLSASPRAVGFFACRTLWISPPWAPIPGVEPGTQWMPRCVPKPRLPSLGGRMVGELKYLTLTPLPKGPALLAGCVIGGAALFSVLITDGKCFSHSLKLQHRGVETIRAFWAGGTSPI